MPRYSALPPTLPPRLISREAAAAYVGISAGTFDKMVEDERMPKPRRIDRRKVWDVRALDRAIDELPVDGQQNGADTSWDDVDHAA